MAQWPREGCCTATELPTLRGLRLRGVGTTSVAGVGTTTSTQGGTASCVGDCQLSLETAPHGPEKLVWRPLPVIKHRVHPLDAASQRHEHSRHAGLSLHGLASGVG